MSFPFYVQNLGSRLVLFPLRSLLHATSFQSEIITFRMPRWSFLQDIKYYLRDQTEAKQRQVRFRWAKHIEVFFQQLQEAHTFLLLPALAEQNLLTLLVPIPCMSTATATAGGQHWATPSPCTSSPAPPPNSLPIHGAPSWHLLPHCVQGGGLPFQAWPQQHHAAPLPMPSSFTMATPASRDKCGGSLAVLWEAWQRPPPHCLPPSQLLTCASLWGTPAITPCPAAMKSGQA